MHMWVLMVVTVRVRMHVVMAVFVVMMMVVLMCVCVCFFLVNHNVSIFPLRWVLKIRFAVKLEFI